MPIPDEKARVWTRPEDYWPPRRLRRKSGPPPISQFASPREGSKLAGERRPLLGIIPYALLMMSLAVLAIAIFVLAWPGRTVRQMPAAPVPAEVGTAQSGSIDRR